MKTSILLRLSIVGVAISLLSPLRAAEPDAGWQVVATSYADPYHGVTLGNGGIGILPWREPFSIRHVMLNHVFDADAEHGISRLLPGLDPFVLHVGIDGCDVAAMPLSEWSQRLDMREAVLRTEFVAGGKARIRYDIRALRSMPYAGLVRVEVEALDNIRLSVGNTTRVPGEYAGAQSSAHELTVDGTRIRYRRTWASAQHRGAVVSASAALLFDAAHAEQACSADSNRLGIVLGKGERFAFDLVGAVCTDRDFIDPWNESDREVIYAVREGVDRLTARHRSLWQELWQGDIEIEGDDEAQQAVRLALYHLYSFAREGSRLSIPPFGLSSQGYNGHIFWDTELWMYPPMLFLNRDIAESMINYRIDRLPAARRKALAYGYRGAMFPWESDDAGEESCPTWALTGPFEHHITADIGIAAWNCYCMSGDRNWLRREGWPLLREIADFWTSRAERNEDGSYSVRNVVCADEYAEGVDDNAFTNGAVIRVLQVASKAAALCGEKAPAAWTEIAGGLRIPRFPDGTTQEYAGYDGRIVKQADANLLAYPLGIVSRAEDIRRDLTYYEPRIDAGPAMSYAILALQHARLGDGEKAYELFSRSYRPNRLAPFGVMAEYAGADNCYFATGAGGMLQTVINGFCGLEITDKGVKQLPSALPKHWKRVTVKGVGPERKDYTKTSR
ncbi:MAG: glycoside hydrolase family 65 protein [Alistipes sp.]|nr:glycoside hydrolase family 65 protein [Alistipes senegalensis]MCM1250539.1 glycoside hydrolase family 65 protein [Alistipes sp.]